MGTKEYFHSTRNEKHRFQSWQVGKQKLCVFLLSSPPRERFHMASWQPYWCSKAMKWWLCCCSKPILFLRKGFLLFQWICTDAGHVSENALYLRSSPYGEYVLNFWVLSCNTPYCSQRTRADITLNKLFWYHAPEVYLPLSLIPTTGKL